MAISEESRHQLYRRLEEVLGEAEAGTLMSHLPPVGWSDVATRRDLDELERRLDLRFEAVDARFEATDARFDAFEARFDARLDAFEARLDARFDAFEARVDARFSEVDSRFDSVDSRFEAKLEQELRRQTWRVVSAVVALAGSMMASVAALAVVFHP